MNVKLNFINQCQNEDKVHVVVFQKNQETNCNGTSVAWRVFENTSNGWETPFTVSNNYEVSALDINGQHSEKLEGMLGDIFQVDRSHRGIRLRHAGKASSGNQIAVENCLKDMRVAAKIYSDGHLLDIQTGGEPGQIALFEFKPVIWIGVASHIVEGQVMPQEIVASINTEINLEGVSSAEVVMKDAQRTSDDRSFVFELQNVVMSKEEVEESHSNETLL